MYQHKFKNYHIAFTSRYSVNKLVYYKGFHSIIEAIAEEKRIKSGSRKNKIILVETSNPNWEDLSGQLWFENRLIDYFALLVMTVEME